MAVNAPIDQSEQTNTTSIINDFAFSVATPNGSGSQTSNNVLVKSLFHMGIPVNGKNLFPSNIKGLPTWYTIRVSKDGYVARRATTEIIVAFNQDTVTEDIADTPAGGVVLYRDDLQIGRERDDLTYYAIPVKQIMREVDVPRQFKDRMENMTYVGAVAQLFDIPLERIRQSLMENFKNKERVVDSNMSVVQAAFDYAAEHFVKSDPYHFEEMDATKGKILITGNEAGALGAIFGGVHLVSWYPITPSTSLVDAVNQYRYLRRDGDQNTLAIVQAEDELAAAGMIVGAGFGGVRSMTATSGPGISLMAEFSGLAYFAEIPCVFWDITRMGPSTGMPTRTSQGDILFTHFLGHGDSRQLCLLPATPEEAFEFGWRAFDIAEEIQTPVFVISDLDLGMNNWMSEPFEYPDEPMKRGKVLDAEELQAFIDEHGKWGRYMDVDDDGIGYRTLPGTDHPMAAYFARGTGHDEMAVYSERSDVWLENMARLRRKMETAMTVLPQPVLDDNHDENRAVGIISFGTSDPAVQEARDRLRESGIETNYLRIRSLPLHESMTEFVHSHERVYIVENNYDGQLTQIFRIDHPEDLTHVHSLALGDGLPMTAKWIVEQVTPVEAAATEEA